MDWRLGRDACALRDGLVEAEMRARPPPNLAKKAKEERRG